MDGELYYFSSTSCSSVNFIGHFLLRILRILVAVQMKVFSLTKVLQVVCLKCSINNLALIWTETGVRLHYYIQVNCDILLMRIN